MRAEDPTYWRDVRPLLRKHCTVCHSEKNIKEIDVSGALALDSWIAIQKDAVLLFEAGKSAESRLVKVLLTMNEKKRMPRDAPPLSAEAIAVFKKWIDSGAAQGTRPKEEDTVTSVTSGPRKRLDMAIASKLPIPPALAKPKQSGPLELVAPIGPLSPVTAVAFSPDGKLLAAGSFGRVTVWDLANAKPLQSLTNVLGMVNDLRFSPDGKLLAAAGGQPSAKGDLRIFSTVDWKLQASFGGHTDVVSSIAFSTDGALLASASFDKTVRIWDVATRTTTLTFTGHSDFVYAVAFGPKGEWFATASKDRTSRMVDTKTGKSKLTFSGMEQDVMAVAIKPDGSQVITSGFEAQLHWWDTKTGARSKRQGGHDTATHELAITPDDSLLASAGADKTVRLWNTKTGASVRVLPVGSIPYSVALRPDGKQVAAGSFDGLIRIWETDAGRQLATLFAASGDAPNAPDWLALAPEGYAAASDGFVAKARWRAGGQVADSVPLWAALRKPELVGKALLGEKLPDVKFAAPAK